MSTRLPFIVATLMFSAASLHAEDAAVESTASKTKVQPYQLKNRSVFDGGTEDARAPFWPIGWVKTKAGTATTAQEVAVPKMLLDEKSFKVTSILLGSGTTPSLAVINGRAYSEGEFVRMPKNGPNPRIRVQRISDGIVILQNAEQTLTASLDRPQLSGRKSEELYLDPDR